MITSSKMYVGLVVMLFLSHLIASATDNKDSSMLYLQRALAFGQQVNPAEVSVCFQKAIQFDSANTAVKIKYAAFLANNRKVYEAIVELTNVLQIEPKNQEALQKIVELNFLLRRWSDVIRYANLLPQTHRLNYILGTSYYQVENYGMAKAMLLQAVKDDPLNLSAYKTLGKVFIELDEYYNAINSYKEAYNLDSTDPYFIYEYGLLFYTTNNEKDAVRFFELAAAKGYTPDLDFYENLGSAYLSFDIEKGVAILNRVLENKPNNRSILMEIAHARFRKKQYELASGIFRHAYEMDASNYQALYMLGLCTIRKGDKLKGNELCEKAIRFDPSLQNMRRLSFVN